MATEAVKCCDRVYDSVSMRMYPCTNNAKVERDGKPYCGVHDPDRKKKRDAAQDAKWAAQAKARDERDAKYRLDASKAAMFDELVEAVDSGYSTWAAFSGMYQAYQGMKDAHPVHVAEMKKLKNILERAYKLQAM